MLLLGRDEVLKGVCKKENEKEKGREGEKGIEREREINKIGKEIK